MAGEPAARAVEVTKAIGEDTPEKSTPGIDLVEVGIAESLERVRRTELEESWIVQGPIPLSPRLLSNQSPDL